MSETNDGPTVQGSGHEPDIAVWSRTVRERREAAGLSQADLARRAGLSEGTIKRVESGKDMSRDTLLRLAGLPELRLHETPVAGLGLAELERDNAPNCWIAPGFNALDQWQEMLRELNGQGGYVDQTYLYLDHSSAAGWHAIATHGTRSPDRAAMPLDKAASAILDSTGSVGLDIIGLGPGDAQEEVRVVLCLLGDPRHRDLRLFLLDVSQPLLSAGFEYATEALADYERISVTAVQGNFHHLSRYRHLLYTPRRSHRRRLVTMLGGTFVNLLNEPLFIRNSLAGFGPGDLMLFNAGLVYAPADRPEEIRKKDRWLSGVDPRTGARLDQATVSSPAREWMAGPLRRYVKGIQDVSITTDLDLRSCPVPGSYAVVHRATVTLTGDETRTFSLFYMKRYDELKLVECFRLEGWDSVGRWHYGTGHPSVLYLFRKR